MWLRKTTDSLDILYRPMIKLLNSIAMGILAAMMFLTATDVILRYIFNRPISGAYELIEYMMAILIPFALAYCALQGSHGEHYRLIPVKRVFVIVPNEN